MGSNIAQQPRNAVAITPLPHAALHEDGSTSLVEGRPHCQPRAGPYNAKRKWGRQGRVETWVWRMRGGTGGAERKGQEGEIYGKGSK